MTEPPPDPQHPGSPPPSGYPPPGYPPPGPPPPGSPPPPGYGYPPPGYGYPQQGWGQPGWGQQPWGPARGTNTLAIIALVSIFVFTPAALVLGVIARKQIQQTGEDGSGMALAAIICGAISVVLFVLVIGLVVLGLALGTGHAGTVHQLVVTPG